MGKVILVSSGSFFGGNSSCKAQLKRDCPMATGRPQYAGEYERIMGQNKLATKRRANRFARRSRALVLAYSTTMAASYLLLMAHALSQTAPTIAAL